MNFNLKCVKRFCCAALIVMMLIGICSVSVSAGVVGSVSSVITTVTADFENGYKSQDINVLVVDDNGNKVLQQKINSNSGKMYFELRDNSGKPVQLNDNRVYVINLDYKIVKIGGEDRTQPTTINLVRNTANGGELVKVKNFTGATHYIGESNEWKNTSVVFKSSISDSPEYNRLGINVVSLSCPSTSTNVEDNMTVIWFDNIVIAECNENTKTVEFVSNGGSSCDIVAGQAGEPVSLPTPTREFYDFNGWYSDIELKNAYNKSTIPSDFNTKLYAKWTHSADAILINFKSGSGGDVPSIVGRKGDAVTLPLLKRDGYHFAGWYNKELTERQNITVMPESSITLYAKWEVIPIVCDFENKDDFPTPNNSTVTKRCAIEQQEVYRGKNALSYSFQRGFELSGSSDPSAIAGVLLFDDKGEKICLNAGTKYKISFKYKVIENSEHGVITMVAASEGGAWSERRSQIDLCKLQYDASDIKKGWQSHTFEFVWTPKSEKGSFAYIGFSGDGVIWVDEIIIYEASEKFDVNKSMLCFETNGAPLIDSVYGDYDTEYELPTLEKEGYRFLGWCYDEDLTLTVEDKYKFEKPFAKLYADWFKIPAVVETIEPEPDTTLEPEPEVKKDNTWIFIVVGAVAGVIVIAVVVIIVVTKKKSVSSVETDGTAEDKKE